MKLQTGHIKFGQEGEGIFLEKTDANILVDCLEEVIKNMRWCADIPASDVMFLSDTIRMIRPGPNKTLLRDFSECMNHEPELQDWMEGKNV